MAECFANADADTIKAHVDRVAAELRRMWGDQFKVRIDAIDELVAGVGGELGEALAASPWVLADVLLMTQLDQVPQHRARKRS